MRKMTASVLVAVMSSAFFNPSFAFSSHFDSGGAPLSELSWPSSLAVVAVSFSGLFTFVFLMLACLCCKKGDINFKEFENPDGEESRADALASPGSQTEVYILPLTEVSLPVSKQPGRSIQFLKSSDLGRHSLLYLKEIGHGWFGKVLLGEVNAGLSTTQVVVKELKASASVQDQMQFLEEAQPYRTLQHPALLQCLAQCSEVTPYLLVMEFCPLGDVKGYLRSCRASDTVTPDPLILQRMACEIASGLLHLHKHNFIHSDLALRNCLLTSEMTVKIGDYGLSHSRYRDDYFVTADQIWVPLRWIAPELIDEVHGNLLVVDQTKASNVWSLGVTIWELFELANQPYRHYSDRQVLTYAIKEQQLKLPKPLLKVPLSERWYEVMQFCWLQPEQRPVAEEVHLLLSYLCAKGMSEAEEDFEKRWNSLRPGMGGLGGGSCGGEVDGAVEGGSPGASAAEMAASSVSSSFPLLEHFSGADGFHTAEAGDDILTVTETSHGLNFEYKWQQARAEQPYCSSSTTGTLGQSNPHYEDIYYPLENVAAAAGGKGEGLALGVSPSYYESDHLGVVPVLSAHSPSVSSEYYIRIEEPVECNIRLEDTNLDYSPGLDASQSSAFSAGGRERPAVADPEPNTYWSAAEGRRKTSAYDSDDASPDISLCMEPLPRRASEGASSADHERPRQYFSPSERGGTAFHCDQPLSPDDQDARHRRERYMDEQEGRWSPLSSRGQRLTGLDTPMGISLSLSSPSLGCCDPYLEANQASSAERSAATEGYYDMTGTLQKSLPRPHYISINVEVGDGLHVGSAASEPEEDDDLFTEAEATNWTSNQSANNNSLNFDSRPAAGFQDIYLDLHHTTPSSSINASKSEKVAVKDNSGTSKPVSYLEAIGSDSSSTSTILTTDLSGECETYIHLCHKGGQETASPVTLHPSIDNSQITEPVSHSGETIAVCKKASEKIPNLSVEESRPHSGGRAQNHSTNSTKPQTEVFRPPSNFTDINPTQANHSETGNVWGLNTCNTRLSTPSINILSGKKVSHAEVLSECISISEGSGLGDSGVNMGCSSISLIDIYDCSDDDTADVTSGVLADSPLEYAEVGDVSLAHRPLLRPVKAPHVEEAINLASSSSPCESFSLDVYHTSVQPKSLDSGYDTENNESPEFILKDLEGKPILSVSLESDEPDLVLQLDLDESIEGVLLTPSSNTDEPQLGRLNERNPYRDSAYFSDYDAENDRSPSDGVSSFFGGRGDDGDDIVRLRAEKGERVPESERREGYCFASLKDSRVVSHSPSFSDREFDPSSSSSPFAASPALNVLSPFPPQMGGCLTKESAPDDGIGLETEHSVDEASSDCCLSSPMEGSSGSQDTVAAAATFADKGSGDYSPVVSLDSNSTLADLSEETLQDTVDREEHRDDREDNNPDLQLDVKKIGEGDDTDGDDTPSNGDGAYDTVLMAELASPDLGLDGDLRAPLGDGEDADEEDSDDSESDEELRSYNIQEEPSDESDEDFTAVPVVVSERSSARHLRSLLKMPTLLTQSFCDELERKKKAVSFFDDVTVFLFDQESPTGDLADYSFPPAEANCHPSEVQTSNPSDGNNAENSDENAEEGGCFEWEEEDFPLMPSPTSAEPAPDAMVFPPSPPSKVAEEKPAPQLSRFSVSRFSITHVSDSDVDSVGGCSEDGERE
ncbi:serine/threonine-protein kinase LMTK1 isoform X1 [Alosa sapidissima]|uniref:serine/threonine-protein kinase LMTK1 isoform X1 n=1 Tax=Alosa sapidissima TaxID=34773 RepID=UPI001C09C11D|nr:serine/threonine-protein kinase LMTK1 isoform X1 [Alosa sapidissima]